MLEALIQKASFAASYQTSQARGGRGSFSATVEARKGGEIAISFLQHMAIQRNVRNIFEKRDVVGITNYVDVGFELVSNPMGHSYDRNASQRELQATKGMESRADAPGASDGRESSASTFSGNSDASSVPRESAVGGMLEEGNPSSAVRLAAAWQINKNSLIKGRLGLDSMALAGVLKGWWQPSLTVGVSLEKQWGGPIRCGFTVSVETYGNLR